MRKAISSAIINDNKEILLVKKHDTRILPWWKPEKWENDLECLSREVDEELNWAKLNNVQFYKSVSWKTPHSWNQLEARVYFAELITEALQASAELSDARFIKDFDNYKISNITNKILKCLKETWHL